jgi:hypothetical protein
MDYQEYRAKYHKNTTPRYNFDRGFSAALYTAEYAKAVAFYSVALGEPQYVEGENTPRLAHRGQLADPVSA